MEHIKVNQRWSRPQGPFWIVLVGDTISYAEETTPNASQSKDFDGFWLSDVQLSVFCLLLGGPELERFFHLSVHLLQGLVHLLLQSVM